MALAGLLSAVPGGASGSASYQPEEAQATVEAGPIVREIDETIATAVKIRASDIHFEPTERHLVCRYRLDGILSERKRLPAERAPALLSRIKIMAGLDIAEKRRPQDGRIRFTTDDRAVDIRVSVIPTRFGEKAVLRLLDREHLRLDLAELGMPAHQQKLFTEKISLPNGIVLVTGPTGSGKTTTLYAALQHLKSPQVNISTVEDPIEYELEGINQTQVKPEINLTFAGMLRALLRQDPNIIMVGEIRDRETLEIAIRASLTGHLVLSTVHTNSAVATITRLLDMGAEPYMLASCLRLVVAQRLVRLVCNDCAQSTLSPEYRAAAERLRIEVGPKARSSRGCESCDQTGYRGRTAIYEMLSINDALREAISGGATEQELHRIATADGFSPMAAEAERLVNDGRTSPIEVLRELTT